MFDPWVPTNNECNRWNKSFGTDFGVQKSKPWKVVQLVLESQNITFNHKEAAKVFALAATAAAAVAVSSCT